MKIALDVMGFENKINEAILAARKFSKDYPGAKIVLVGHEGNIRPCLQASDNFEIVHCPESINMDDTPITALRKKDTSMLTAIKLVKTKKVDAVVSAGSTSCFVPLVQMNLGSINNVDKFGFMPYIPTTNKVGFNMIDVGANINVSGADLYNFALMANEYVRIVRKIHNPKIGVLNIGTEHHKGFAYHKEAFDLLKKNKYLNFVGFVEPKGLLDGAVDICVCDGFSGNICLKALEGALKSVGHILKQGYKKPWNWLGAAFSLPIITTLTRTFDYRNNAGAIVLGANGIAIKTHGSADAKQFYAALRMAYDCVENNLLHNIKHIKYE
ncbi:MAG: phosphate acyltransferase PlsX [Mycoplasma sp.]|nr:phosphate acyltransferase PlsX [Candidatus Hennigella equi]